MFEQLPHSKIWRGGKKGENTCEIILQIWKNGHYHRL